MKRVLLPPLAVNLLLLALAVYCLSSEESLAVEKQDSSVQFAAALVLVASIIGYPILLIINFLDSVFDRHGFRSWLWTACLISGFATFTVLSKVGSEHLGSLILGSLLVPSIVLLPMSVMRRLMKPRMTGDVQGPVYLSRSTNHGPPPSLSRIRKQNKIR